MAVFSVSIRELRPRLPEVIADIKENMNRYVITKRGKPTAIILNTEDYDTLIESLGIQTSEILIKEVAEAEESFKKKKGRRIEDIKMEL